MMRVAGSRRPVALAAAFCMVALSGGCVRNMGDETTVISPSGRLEVAFLLVDGAPHYRVAYNDTEVIAPSLMGFKFKQAEPLDRGLEIDRVSMGTSDETWKPVWGQFSEIRNHYNEMTIHLIEKYPSRRRMNVIFRVYDDGLGFRYELPLGDKGTDAAPETGSPGDEDAVEYEITSEETRFAFSGDHAAWWIPADFDSYEHLYTQSRLSEVGAASTPITVEISPDLYVSVHEANLTDYPEMTLASIFKGGHTFKAALAPWPDGVLVKASMPFVTPWRTIQIARRPGGLIESSLILNLNDACKIEDTSWIRPMKYLGIWWGMHIGKYSWHVGPDHGATTENVKRHIDFAARHGIPGLLIEGWNTGWDRWGQKDAYDYVTSYPDFDLEEVVRYARSRGVTIIGHHETGGDVPAYEHQIDAAFALYGRVGVPAVKTGYAGRIFPRGHNHHGQWMVRHYRMVVEKAAEDGLMLDVHEPIKPTGISRTYPNMMTREGVRGTEYNAWSEGNPPEHETIIPFTRMLAGPLDYTPGIFDLLFEKYKPDNRVHTTLAKQLALYVVLHSPLQMAADLIENYEGHPAFRFIEDVPVTWDETRVLNGKIGDYVTIARRSGDAWFVGSVTDECRRELSIGLSFLDAGIPYVAHIYADGPGADWQVKPAEIDISEREVDSTVTLTLDLAPGGGQAISIRPRR